MYHSYRMTNATRWETHLLLLPWCVDIFVLNCSATYCPFLQHKTRVSPHFLPRWIFLCKMEENYTWLIIEQCLTHWTPQYRETQTCKSIDWKWLPNSRFSTGGSRSKTLGLSKFYLKQLWTPPTSIPAEINLEGVCKIPYQIITVCPRSRNPLISLPYNMGQDFLDIQYFHTEICSSKTTTGRIRT